MSDRDDHDAAPAIAAWARSFASALDALGGDRFPGALAALVRDLVACDAVLALRYAEDRRPVVLLDESRHAERRNDLAAYVEGPYLLDPFFLKAASGVEGVLRLRDIVADDFLASRYFHRYYKLSHVRDEVNLLVCLEPGASLALSFERAESSPEFDAGDLARFEAVYPAIAALARADWPRRRAEHVPGGGGDRRHASLRERLDEFGADVLTPREREIVALLLRGYDANEAAAALGRSVETIRVHRKNLYRKLDVGSLAELFALVLDDVLAAAD